MFYDVPDVSDPGYWQSLLTEEGLDGGEGGVGELDRMVRRELLRMRARKEARELFEQENRQVDDLPPDRGTLAEILAREPEPPARVEGLVPWQGSTLIVAQRKTGKTTLALNLARDLLLGGQFLGRFRVTPIAGRVGFLNFEVSGQQLARWAVDTGVPADRLVVVNLRGRPNPFADPDRLAELGEWLRAQVVEVLMVDPLSRAQPMSSRSDANGGNDATTQWLVQLDEFAVAAGARNVILTAHAGWNGERARGASAIEDWADSIVYLKRDENTDDQARYLSAQGRDVDVEEDRLEFDPDTRRLTLTGAGSRRRARSEQDRATDRELILTVLSTHRHEFPSGMSGKDLATLAGGRKDRQFTDARNSLLDDGTLASAKRNARGGGLLYAPSAWKLPNMPKPTDSVSPEHTEPPPYTGGSCSVPSSSEGTEPQIEGLPPADGVIR